MKSYLDGLLARRPVPTHANGFFPLRRPPESLVDGHKARKTPKCRRPWLGRPPVSER